MASLGIQLPNPLPAGSGSTLPLAISVAGFQSKTVQLPVAH